MGLFDFAGKLWKKLKELGGGVVSAAKRLAPKAAPALLPPPVQVAGGVANVANLVRKQASSVVHPSKVAMPSSQAGPPPNPPDGPINNIGDIDPATGKPWRGVGGRLPDAVPVSSPDVPLYYDTKNLDANGSWQNPYPPVPIPRVGPRPYKYIPLPPTMKNGVPRYGYKKIPLIDPRFELNRFGNFYSES